MSLCSSCFLEIICVHKQYISSMKNNYKTAQKLEIIMIPFYYLS